MAYLFDSLTLTGYYELKIAKLVPLFKSDDNILIINYTPVLNNSGKYSVYRLIEFLNMHGILYKYQIGFREKHVYIFSAPCIAVYCINIGVY